MIRKRIRLNATAATATDQRINLTIPTGATVRLNAASGDGLRCFRLEAYTGGLLNLPNYDIPVVFDLGSMRTQANISQIPLLRDHDFAKGVGHSDDVTIDVSTGVTGTGVMSVESAYRDEVVASADNGKQWQLSIGGTSTEGDIEYVDETREISVNNRGLRGPLLLVRHYLLREISFVETGADETGAIATLIAAFDGRPTGTSKMNFEAWLKSLGIDIKALTADGLKRLRSQFDAEMNQDDDSADDTTASDETIESDSDAEASVNDEAIAESAGTAEVDDAVAQSLADRTADHIERTEQLETLNARFGSPEITVNERRVSLLAHAVRQRWTPDRFELECRRRARPQRMNPRRGGAQADRVNLLAAMQFAILSHANVPLDRDFRNVPSARLYLNASFNSDPNADARQRAMDQSHDYRHHTLVELIASAMALDSECDAPARSDRWWQAAFSSNAVQDLFTQSTQAILLNTFEESMSMLEMMARSTDVPNFKKNERKVVDPNTGELEIIPSTGTAGDATLTASGEEFKIARFGKRWGIDDQDMINEDFGVFEEMPQFLGRSARRLAGQLIAKLLLDNPNLKDGNPWFTGSNLRTTSALTAANLKASLTAFGVQQSGDVSLDLDPNVILTPKALRFTAAEILADAPRITGSDSLTTSRNVLADTIDRQLHDSLLDNGLTDPADRGTTIAGDATSWYLADTRYPAIELAHLNGTGRGPTIRTGVYSDGKYGVWVDVKRDIGAAPLRRQSIQKNTA